MIYAIDKYGIGSEREVGAQLFYGKFIPQKHGRFFCPVCGEPVFWCSRGGKQPDKFSHYSKTDSSPECEKRVDGSLKLNLYERVGLPIYLTARMGYQFCLNIGFPALGEQLLLKATQHGAKVCVTGAETQKTIAVDTSHFLEDSVTLIPVNFVPRTGENFVVTLYAQEKLLDVRKRWSNYADGFGNGGAIFTYDETEGKKIRRGDAVSTERQYYVIARYFRPPQEIQLKELGSIYLSKVAYQVYSIIIHVSTENIGRYRYVENYLKKEFGVWLLQTPPELIPLWPPVIDQGVIIPATSRAKMFCAVSSGNDVPNVYKYDGTEASAMTVEKEEEGASTVVFDVNSQEMILSVDRKYAGREVIFQAKAVARSGFRHDYFMEDAKGVLIEWEDLTQELLSSSVFLNANARMELYIGRSDMTFQHIAVREQRVAVPEQFNSQEIFFVEKDGVFFHVEVKKKKNIQNLQAFPTIDILRGCHGGKWVPVPRWAEYVLLEWGSMEQERLVEEVRKRIRKGKIPVALLKILYNFYC